MTRWGPGGDPRCDCNVILGVSHAALIGRIGAGEPFLVGDDYSSVAGEEGQLWLGINDRRLEDNSGQIVVSVQVRSWRDRSGDVFTDPFG